MVAPDPAEDPVTAPATARPAIDGWFEASPEPRLVGQSCRACGTTVFPPTATTCPNPACRGDVLDPRPLARTATVWSWATNHYEPPAPYVPPDPFVPYTVVAAELDGEGIVVLGQLSADADPSDLHVGAPVQVVVETLFADNEGPRTIWRFALTDRSPA